MTESGTPVRRQTTRLLAGGKKHGYATLLLYPNKLAAVSSGAVRIGMSAGAIVVFSLTLLIPPHTGPGALGALIGVGAGYLIGGSYSSLKERAGVKRGFGLRFRGSRGVCRAC